MPVACRFSETATYSELDQSFSEGEIIKATMLPDEFDCEEFTNQNPDELAILTVGSAGQLTVLATDTGAAPASRQTVIALVAALNTKPVDAEFE